METKEFYDRNGGIFRVFTSDKIENVNPVEYFKNAELEKRAITLRDLLKLKESFLTSFLDFDFFKKEAEKTLVGFFEKFEHLQLDSSLEKLLTIDKKRNN